MPLPEITYKPKYNGSMRFALLLYPAWIGLFLYFIYEWFVTRSFSPQGFLAIVFGLMVVSLLFRVFKEIRFGDEIVVKRFLLPDIKIDYKDVTEFNRVDLKSKNANISLLMITSGSLDELETIINRLNSARKIKLVKVQRGKR